MTKIKKEVFRMLKFIYTNMELTDCKGRISKSQTLAHLEDETLLNDEKKFMLVSNGMILTIYLQNILY